MLPMSICAVSSGSWARSSMRRSLRWKKLAILGDKLFGGGLFPAHLYASRRGRLYLRGRDGPAGIARRQTRTAACASAVPAVVGLYGKPTIINNVETFTNVPLILANGADWYKSMGTADSAGVKVFSLSGRVRKPGNYELPFGTTFRELIYTHGGGVQDSRAVKAIMPAGASSSLILVNDDEGAPAGIMALTARESCTPPPYV